MKDINPSKHKKNYSRICNEINRVHCSGICILREWIRNTGTSMNIPQSLHLILHSSLRSSVAGFNHRIWCLLVCISSCRPVLVVILAPSVKCLEIQRKPIKRMQPLRQTSISLKDIDLSCSLQWRRREAVQMISKKDWIISR